MRVLVIGPSLLMPWTTYTVRGLARLGQSVAVFYYNNMTFDRLTGRATRALAANVPGVARLVARCRQTWQEARDERLLRVVERVRPQLILVLWGHTLSAEIVRRVKARGRCPVVTWWVDDPFRYASAEVLALYDRFFVFDRSYMTSLTGAGVPSVEFLPCACDETVFFPRRLTRRDVRRYGCDVALVGWYYPSRAEVVRALKHLDLRIWGRGWATAGVEASLNGGTRRIVRSRRFIRDDLAARIYSATTIGLNVHHTQSREAGLNMRSFELLAAGAFELVDRIPGMEELLEPGREVAVYGSPEEARGLAEYYLRHPEERVAIATRGHERVLREHTYVHRMQTLLRAVTSCEVRS